MGFDVHTSSEVQQVLDDARRRRPELAGWTFTLRNEQPTSLELVATTEGGKGSWKMLVPLDGTANGADIELAVIALLETARIALAEEGPVSTPWLRT